MRSRWDREGEGDGKREEVRRGRREVDKNRRVIKVFNLTLLIFRGIYPEGYIRTCEFIYNQVPNLIKEHFIHNRT